MMKREFRVARLYQNRQKTMRQCVEMLSVDLEEMMDILIELGIPFGHDDLEDQLKSVEKVVKQMQPSSQD